VQVVSRDRAGAFADAIAKGAPSASQVADRWHLLNNLLETLIGLLEHHRGTVREVRDSFRAAREQLSVSHESDDTLTKTLQQKKQNRERRIDLYQRMRDLIDNGKSQVQAAAILGLGLRTVQRWVACGVFRERKHRVFSSQVDAFGPYLEKRVADGCTSATALWREISRKGYQGRGRQRLGLAAATVRRAAKHTDRRSTRKEKIAPLPRKTGLADAEDYSPKKSLSQGSLSSFCGAEVFSPSGQKLLRDDSQARWVAVASLATNGLALAPGFLRSALAAR
jgi:hypothetical protein